MKFYIDLACYIENKRKNKGFIHTYDWTVNENVTTWKNKGNIK